MTEQNTIRAIFTDKADAAVNEIIKKFGLEESVEQLQKKSNEGKPANIVLLVRAARKLAMESISQNDFTAHIQKELAVLPEIANSITKEVVLKVVPFVLKVPEETFNNIDSREEISKKVFGQEPAGASQAPTFNANTIRAEKPLPQIMPKPGAPKNNIPTPEKPKKEPPRNKEKDLYREEI